MDGRWPDGFQATVTVTTERAVAGRQVSWTFPDGRRIGRIWNATAHQNGTRVTVTAAGRAATAPARTTLSFGFLGTGQTQNRAPYDFRLDQTVCAAG
ncbi:cellulose binding domain-containing protein [Streptomyces sp. SCL15-4]|uniref:cellulose binding domain-containing protein n=1 Tax=Streptomyces sp. SCL15-4 TaxID=2967221 RepID=UPI002966F9A2|nr:cellulose binding domain-containing protein [Streptomyces sp. SCL15-4]